MLLIAACFESDAVHARGNQRVVETRAAVSSYFIGRVVETRAAVSSYFIARVETSAVVSSYFIARVETRAAVSSYFIGRVVETRAAVSSYFIARVETRAAVSSYFIACRLARSSVLAFSVVLFCKRQQAPARRLLRSSLWQKGRKLEFIVRAGTRVYARAIMPVCTRIINESATSCDLRRRGSFVG